MESRTLRLHLRTFGTRPTAALVELDVLTRSERMKRAGTTLGASLVAALIALPIPLVHFVFVPGALAAGIIVAAMRLRQEEIFHRATGPCPSCATEQDFMVAGIFRLPKKLHCGSCHRELTLEATTT